MKKIEYVDIYDKNKQKTGVIKIRHVDTFDAGEYIIGVQLIIINSKKEILITKRSLSKKVLPGKWECNGGAIDSGETSLEGLKREIIEELGIELVDSKIKFFKTVINENEHVIKEIFVYNDDIDISDISFSDNEACDAKYVTIKEFMKMYNSGDIVYNVNFDEEDYKLAIEL